MAQKQINQLNPASTLSTSDLFPVAQQLTNGTYDTASATIQQVVNLVNANSYVLPTATTSTLGGVKIDGSTITISSGVISSTTGQYTLPAATSTTLGGVTIGAGISNNAGNISVTYGTGSGTSAQGNDSRIVNAVSSASPAFTGTPTAPTATTGTNTTQLATTAFVLGQSFLTTSTLPVGSSTVLGVVKPDGTTISNSTGAISVTYGTAASTAAQGNDSRITGAAPAANPTFTGAVNMAGAGTVTAPTLASTSDNSTNVATTSWVTSKVAAISSGVTQVLGFSGAVTFTQLTSTGDGSGNKLAPLASPTFTGTVTIPSGASISGFAPLASPTFTGSPTVPGYLTTSSASSTYAPLASPTFTGTPTAATAAANTSTTQLATTSFVTTADALKANIASPTFTGTVTIPSGASISGYATLASPTFTGTVTIPSGASISGFAPLASPALTGTPTAPTVSTSDNSTTLATTAWVGNKIASVSSGVTAVVGFSGNVTLANLVSGGVAQIASPTFTGTPAAPTASAGTNTTQLATTAFVTNAVAAATTGVSSVLGFTGAVTFSQLTSTGDGSGNKLAPLASPTFTGTVTIPSGASISGFATLASPTFTGTVTIPSGASISGFATLASPALTGTPTAPTASGGTNTTQLATTAFVTAAVSASTTGVSSVLGFTGAVTFTQLTSTGDGSGNKLAPLASPAFTGTPTSTTPAQNNNTTQVATTAYVIGQLSGYATLDSPTLTGTPTVPGYLTSSTAASTYATKASPVFTGTVDMTGASAIAATASASDSSTTVATTAHVKNYLASGSSGSIYTGIGAAGFYYSNSSGQMSVKSAYPAQSFNVNVINGTTYKWSAPVDVLLSGVKSAAVNLTGSNGYTFTVSVQGTSVSGLSSITVTGSQGTITTNASTTQTVSAGQEITFTVSTSGTVTSGSNATLFLQYILSYA